MTKTAAIITLPARTTLTDPIGNPLGEQVQYLRRGRTALGSVIIWNDPDAETTYAYATPWGTATGPADSIQDAVNTLLTHAG